MRKKQNSGVWVRGEVSSHPTIIVSGIPRSGTTMMVSALEAMGVPMHGPKDNNREDHDFSNRLAAGQLERVWPTIKKMNVSSSVWGFKRPFIWLNTDRFRDILDNPTCVLMTRDITSMAVRDTINTSVTFVDRMKGIVHELQMLTSFVESTDLPVCCVSYEKMLQQPMRTASIVAGWLRLPRPMNSMWCKPESKDYEYHVE